MNNLSLANEKTKIQVRGLEFFYDNQKSLKSIDMTIPEKRITAIIGPSGCGKSTLLRVFNRIYAMYPKQEARGEVLLNGENILAPGYSMNRLRSHVGMVFQKPVPFPMSIYDNISYAIKHHEKLSRREMEDRVEQALRGAALWDEVKDKLKQSATGLSGGQQQRLCIARTIALRPQVLLLDEPTSALDRTVQKQIVALLRDLQIRHGLTYLFISHDLAVVHALAHDLIVIKDGKVVEQGPSREIFAAPQQAYTQELLRSSGLVFA
ncbi:Phosphate import ATP-binding protein PstB [Pseudomonas syringae pv. aptata]|uniref:Phosphate import ATP-binding protein PstB n=1 Tax=Pseudomonas syringae pv. aptata TaxID=83167 RepID=A0A3M5X0H0_PSEAP|nr:Phosphate import ATP-binding protein PstB [Pseudomonas syringae pv. aptata]